MNFLVMTDEIRPEVRFFARRESLRAWFEKNHRSAKELWIGYYKRGSGRKGLTYAEAVEEALCFGWIDGQIRSVDEMSYANRYTPRRPGSRWSRVNVAKVKELSRTGRMRPTGLKVFTERTPGQLAGYSFEERPKEFDPPLAREFREAKEAWRFFQVQPPYYRRAATFWVMSARLDQTRRRRLSVLIKNSGQRRRIGLLAPGSGTRKR